jgi:hypothetical protein
VRPGEPLGDGARGRQLTGGQQRLGLRQLRQAGCLLQRQQRRG